MKIFIELNENPVPNIEMSIDCDLAETHQSAYFPTYVTMAPPSLEVFSYE